VRARSEAPKGAPNRRARNPKYIAPAARAHALDPRARRRRTGRG
jgi:hypothetical protein